MAENKLPSGVGKKIVQALKKQAEIEIQPIPDVTSTPSVALEHEANTEAFENAIVDNVSLESEFSDFSADNTLNIDEETESVDVQPTNDFAASFDSTLIDDLEAPMFDEPKDVFNSQSTMSNTVQNNYAMPTNVAVLKRLIMQLPQGVSKQTGAQIIRQTMEALGISMNSVLKEAQQGQDNISANAKACMTTIAEYRNHIKNLEKQVQDYKKQAIALNELISLFVMTDK